MMRRVREIYNLLNNIIFEKKLQYPYQEQEKKINSQKVCAVCKFREAKDLRIKCICNKKLIKYCRLWFDN